MFHVKHTGWRLAIGRKTVDRQLLTANCELLTANGQWICYNEGRGDAHGYVRRNYENESVQGI